MIWVAATGVLILLVLAAITLVSIVFALGLDEDADEREEWIEIECAAVHGFIADSLGD